MNLSSETKDRLVSGLTLLFFCFNAWLSIACIQHNMGSQQYLVLQISVYTILYFIAAICFVQYLLLKDVAYRHYVLYILVNVLYFTNMSSFESERIDVLPNWFLLLRYYLSIPLLIGSYIIYTYFSLAFLQLAQKDPVSEKWLKRFIVWYTALFVTAIISYSFANSNFIFGLRSVLLIGCMPVGIASVVLVYMRLKNQLVRIFTIGSLLFALGSIMGFVVAGAKPGWLMQHFPFNRWIFFTQLGIMLEMFMFFSSFAYRNKTIAEEEKAAQMRLLLIRNNIAKDLHDELGSTLTSIKILADVSLRNMDRDNGKSRQLLQQIQEQSTQMQQGMSDIVWAIEPSNDKLENMGIRMREFTTQLLEPKGIATQFSISQEALRKKIGTQQRKDLFLIFKEAVNNIAKYANCQQAKIELSGDADSIHLHILDDGQGFDTNKITSSNGLRNMKARATDLNGLLSIASQPNKGTHIHLHFPCTT
jgi:signal transduction histidine kinase